MWFAWDSFHYHSLAQHPLDKPFEQLAFPLVYPMLAKAVSFLIGGHTATAMLLVSNGAFVLLLYYGHRLAELFYRDDEAAARRFTKYLVLMPAAFLFHAAMTESLFVCLALAAFYYAERRRWLLVGVIGYFLAATRSVGFLTVIPLALLLLRQHRYRLDAGTLRAYVKGGAALLLVPAGWLSFMAFCKWQSGDWFAYQRAQEKGWGIVMQNPLLTVWKALTSEPVYHQLRMLIALAVIGAVLAAPRRLGLPYVVFALAMVAMPLAIGEPVNKSLIRYLLPVFPFCLVLAHWARRPTVDMYLTAGLALLQGVTFALWFRYDAQFMV
jgi:hypothetical protein